MASSAGGSPVDAVSRGAAIAGVLLKWTNPYSGYRRRLAVLVPRTAGAGAELRLYKLAGGGSERGAPPGPLERTTAAGAAGGVGVHGMGADGAALSSAAVTGAAGCAQEQAQRRPDAPQCTLSARIQLRGAALSASTTDERRLTVAPRGGGAAAVLRAESGADRDAWLAALRAAAAEAGAASAQPKAPKAQGAAKQGGEASAQEGVMGDAGSGGGGGQQRAGPPDSAAAQRAAREARSWSIGSAAEGQEMSAAALATEAATRHKTEKAAAAAAAERGLSRGAAAAAAAADAAATEWRAGRAALAFERHKRQALLDYLRTLEEDKRELELRLLRAQAALAQASAVNDAENLAMLIPPSPLNSIDSSYAPGQRTPHVTGDGGLSFTSGIYARSEAATDLSDIGAAEEDFYDASEELLDLLPPAMATTVEEEAPAGAVEGVDDGSKELHLSNTSQPAVAAPQRRTSMPVPIEKERNVSLWAIIKDAIGKDLTRICLPVFFNEPLSALQKSAEDAEYTYLLDQAALTSDPAERLALVAAFAVSGYASTLGRTKKPFNPLLGETYEAHLPDKGVRFLAEKVVHHPTTLAVVAEGNGWRYEGDAILRSKFWGRSIEVTPHGVLRVSFADGESFHWSKVTSSIHNLIIGKLYCDHYGTMRIKGSRAGLKCKLRFKESNILERNPHQVLGQISVASTGERLWHLLGKWDNSISMVSAKGERAPSSKALARAAATGENLGGRLLWRVHPRNPKERYSFTPFAVTLNEITPDLQGVCPTDCRLRPDQRAQEEGRYDLANKEKQRLEHKQREARKKQDKGVTPPARWFKPVPSADGTPGKTSWQYLGGYWDARTKGHWEGVRNIFGLQDSHWRNEDGGLHFGSIAGTFTLPAAQQKTQPAAVDA